MMHDPGDEVTKPTRVDLLDSRDRVAGPQLEVFDHIVASRGKMPPPFAAMLHRPNIARAVADLGSVIRFDGVISDHDRELVISVTAWEADCGFEWATHSALALEAGVSEATLAAVSDDGEVDEPSDADIVAFTRELSRTGHVGDETFERVVSRYGEDGTVELAATVGYYKMVTLFMSACDVC